MMPEKSDFNTYWEHVFRYAFACKRFKNLRVLDIASGEGYGTYALSKVAKSVIGVDISSEAINFARRKYDLDFRVGGADAIPVESGTVDAVVSFETIEHVSDPIQFLNEASRVLSPQGVLIISTPNKSVYLKDQDPNPFHCSELTLEEFRSLLGDRFVIKEIYGQVFPMPPFYLSQLIISKVSNRLAYHCRRLFNKAMTRTFFPEILSEDEMIKVDFVDKIPTLSPAFERFWNPYFIRTLNEKRFGQPTYFIAVAHKR